MQSSSEGRRQDLDKAEVKRLYSLTYHPEVRHMKS